MVDVLGVARGWRDGFACVGGVEAEGLEVDLSDDDWCGYRSES
jgi:hypothetical protein